MQYELKITLQLLANLFNNPRLPSGIAVMYYKREEKEGDGPKNDHIKASVMEKSTIQKTLLDGTVKPWCVSVW